MKNTKEYYSNKKEELKKKLDDTLEKAFASKEEMDKLASHYRITGIYSYSFCNSITIMAQGGTIAQSFQGWKKLKRFVKKGEKSYIDIYRPYFGKEKDEKTGEEKKVLTGFGLSPVFDISQTDGEPLKYDHNSEEKINLSYEEIKATTEKVFGYEIEEKHTGKTRGMTDGKKIIISNMSNNTDKIKTLIHEIAHCKFEHAGTNEGTSKKEIEAEATAYLVMSYAGIDYELSKAYLSGWGATCTDVNKKKIIRVADEIIKNLFKKENKKEEK